MGASIGDRLRIVKGDLVVEGILMPRPVLGDRDCIVLKLDSGYNIGVRLEEGTIIERLGPGPRPAFRKPPRPGRRPGVPEVAFISTGGTIASRVEYRTGAVRPALEAEDLYALFPELSDIAFIRAEVLYSLLSEDMRPENWTGMAERAARYIKEGVDGVVIAHGTDTMAYSAAALSFALRNLPVPVVFVGAQRSSDRPSTDAALNLLGAFVAASRGPFAEVVVAMHESMSDEAIAIHRGTRVRKCHTSRRDAFRSVNAPQLARVVGGQVQMLTDDYERRDPDRELELLARFEPKVALLKFYPGMDPGLLEWLVDAGYKGVVLEGTGLGHVGHYLLGAVRRAVREGVVVCMASQCIWGRVNMNVYERGRDLLAAGVVPLADMLPETALVKLMWVLGSLTEDPEEARKLMLKPFAKEIGHRTPITAMAP
ncbi:Glu-tRNA(Gln) amidotransferase GatDE subunit D [Candidatus Bathyarchaeota archaeon]|nr:MAG: Glu-tRNA(Gln) amidotransferase GatDE subunit D [Candidatus Bathyarchaeota archaeon]